MSEAGLVGCCRPNTTHPPLLPKPLLPHTLPPLQVGSGYTMKELDELIRQLPPGKPWDSARPPPHLCGWKPAKTDDRPDVWDDPRKSVVLEVRPRGEFKRTWGSTIRGWLPLFCVPLPPPRAHLRSSIASDGVEAFGGSCLPS
jgi:hypothetical protein